MDTNGKITFFLVSDFFLNFRPEITEKGLKWTLEVENRSIKYFDQLSGAHSTQKLVKIHNTHLDCEVGEGSYQKSENKKYCQSIKVGSVK